MKRTIGSPSDLPVLRLLASKNSSRELHGCSWWHPPDSSFPAAGGRKPCARFPKGIIWESPTSKIIINHNRSYRNGAAAFMLRFHRIVISWTWAPQRFPQIWPRQGTQGTQPIHASRKAWKTGWRKGSWTSPHKKPTQSVRKVYAI